MATASKATGADVVGKIPSAVWLRVQGIFSLTDGFCAQFLDDEYALLCRRLVAKLARKRPSPLQRGGLDIWAGGTVHTVGAINFLFDPSTSPHMAAEQLSARLGLAKPSVAAKSKTIRDALKLRPNDPDFCRRDVLVSTPGRDCWRSRGWSWTPVGFLCIFGRWLTEGA